MDLSDNVISPLNNLPEVERNFLVQIISEPDAPPSIGNVVKINKCAPISCNSKPVECEKCHYNDTCCSYTLCTNIETDCGCKYNCGECKYNCNSKSSCPEDVVCASNYKNFIENLNDTIDKFCGCQGKK